MTNLVKIDYDIETETAIVTGSGQYSYTLQILSEYPNITNISLYGFSTLDVSAFTSCTWLVSFSADSSLISVNENAFYYCTSLTTFSAPNITTIYDGGFLGCHNLTTFSATNLININNDGFSGCYNLTTFSAPNLKTVGYEAFLNCTNLTTFLAPNIISLSIDAFRGCVSLSYVYLTSVSALVLGFNITLPYFNANFAGVTLTIYLYMTPACYNKGTKILCLNKHFEEEYIPIENLKKGDIVKSYEHGYRKIDAITPSVIINNPNIWNHCMYKMVKTEQNGLLEDLIVTGSHAILVDDLAKYKKKNDTLFLGKTPKINDKYLLLACISNNFKKIEDNKIYTYFHFILENNGDDDQRFGVWANGILSETPSKNFYVNWNLFKSDSNFIQKKSSEKIVSFLKNCYNKICK